MNTNDINKRVVDLDINDVLPNRFQPRVKFNEDAIIELSESIREHGIIQPIIVRPIGDKYEIIAGERRYKASILAGKNSIPAIITDLNDKDSAEIALIENVQRKNLTPIEEAVSYKKILDMGYLTQEQLALKLGRSQSSIANKMRLLHLSDEVQEALVEEKISERHARSLLKLNSPAQQNEMLGRIINERLTVRKTDEEIDKMMNNPVAEVNSTINQGAFVNSNPGFVDVNKIENQAREINNDNATKIDINALLQPDASKPIEPPKQEKATLTSSLFNLFSKSENEKKEEPKKEEETFYSNPYGSFADTNKPLDTNAVYNFEPIPGITDTPVEQKENIQPMSQVEEQPIINVVEPSKTVEPQNIEVIEPVMPKIDLSKFNDQNIFEKKEENITPKPVIEPVVPIPPIEFKPEVVNPTPVVETKEEVIKPDPIIITDYDKQYDPIMPNLVSQKQDKASFNQVISIIRDAASDVEKTGYKIDTDEIDLGSEYRVIITIKKDN